MQQLQLQNGVLHVNFFLQLARKIASCNMAFKFNLMNARCEPSHFIFTPRSTEDALTKKSKNTDVVLHTRERSNDVDRETVLEMEWPGGRKS